MIETLGLAPHLPAVIGRRLLHPNPTLLLWRVEATKKPGGSLRRASW